MGLKVNDKVPLFAVVSRLTNQKGLDLVLEALPGLLEQGGQLALLGAGDPVLQEGSSRRRRNTQGRLAYRSAITKLSRIALWAARTLFWCPVVSNRAA